MAERIYYTQATLIHPIDTRHGNYRSFRSAFVRHESVDRVRRADAGAQRDARSRKTTDPATGNEPLAVHVASAAQRRTVRQSRADITANPASIIVAASGSSSLLQLQEALKTEASFDPSNARRDFRVAMTNGIESLLLPDIVARFRTDAQGMTLLARSVDPQDMPDMLDRGELNLAIGCYESTHPWIRRHELFSETLTCCFNPDLLPIKTPIDEKTYVETPHVVVSMRNTILGCLEDALRDARVELNIVSAGPNFLAVLMMAADTPVLTTLPSRIAHRYADRFGLSTCPVPISFSANPIAMVWHSREDREPGSEWLRQLVRELCPFERAD